MSIRDIITGRQRSDTLPRAVEVADDGSVYTVPTPGAMHDVNIEQVDGNAVVGDGPASNRLPVSLYMQDAAAGDTAVRGDQLNDDAVAATAYGMNVRSFLMGWTDAVWIRLRATTTGILRVQSEQATHDNLNANANIQVGDADVSGTNPVPVETDGDTISQTPTITAGAYAAGDAVGGLLTFANAARVAGGGGVIKDLLIIDDAGQDAEMELWLFRETFTAMADNAPWAPSEADLRKLIAIITTSDGAWFAAGTPSAARVEVSQRYDLVATSMFGQLVTRGTPTFAATDDVTAIVGLLQD